MAPGDDCHLAQERRGIGIDGRPSEHEHHAGIGLDVLGEVAREVLVVDDRRLLLVQLVGDDVERDVEDDAVEAVAADHEAEQLGVLAAAHLDHAAVGEQQPEALHDLDDLRQVEVASVRVGGERAADGEDVG